MDTVKSLLTTIWTTASDMATLSLSDEPREPHNPTPTDTLIVRGYLQTLSLPLELALSIIDFADYYLKIHGQNTQSTTVSASRGIRNVAATLYVVSNAIPYTKTGERMRLANAKFRIRSRDQGWGGDQGCRGTYNGSWTWFEACILRPVPGATLRALPSLPYDTHPEPERNSLEEFGYEIVAAEDGKPRVWRVQCNVCAGREELEHVVEWGREIGEDVEVKPGAGDGKGFVEALREGDRVGVWARAMYPGWENRVGEVEVSVGAVVD